jgi:hypothetical protein
MIREMKERRGGKAVGGQEILTVADGGKKKSLWEGEGKSLYGGASERGESAGFKPSVVELADWLPQSAMDADSAKWAVLICTGTSSGYQIALRRKYLYFCSILPWFTAPLCEFFNSQSTIHSYWAATQIWVRI